MRVGNVRGVIKFWVKLGGKSVIKLLSWGKSMIRLYSGRKSMIRLYSFEHLLIGKHSVAVQSHSPLQL